MTVRFYKTAMACISSLGLLVLTGCRTPSDTTVINPTQEKTIGDWAASQIQSESIGPTDPAITVEVNEVAKRLDRAITAKTPPRILVSDSDSDIVTSLPGGWVIISAHMVELFAGNRDALAGVMAHEFAHVENDDAMRQMSDALGADTLVNMTTQGKYLDASNVAVQLTSFSHDLDDERHTDPEGVRIAYAAGYDPRGILTAIAMLKQVTPATEAFWLQVHPVTNKRIKLLMNDIAAYLRIPKSETSEH
jgi:beta-barrel assembly-enhancing protease